MTLPPRRRHTAHLVRSIFSVPFRAFRGVGERDLTRYAGAPPRSALAVRSGVWECVSQQQTLAALKALAQAGVIRQLSEGTYDRQYAATELFEVLGACEERVVGPARIARSTPR